MTRRAVLRRALIGGTAAAAGVPVTFAQHAPTGPVHLVVPYPAGGPSDATARILQGPLSRELGAPVVVENVAGVSGALAAQRVLAAPPDGRTLLLGSPNELILSPLANASVRLHAEDFRLVQPVAEGVIVLAVRDDLPASSATEVFELARRSQRRPLTYGSVGIGSLYHLIVAHLQLLAGVALTHVPYRGTPQLLQELAGGQIDFAPLADSAALAALVQQRRVRVVAQLGARRSALLEAVPAIAEAPAFVGEVYSIWAGVLAPRATPDATLARLHAALDHALHDPAVRAQLAAQRQTPAAGLSLAEAARFFEAETARYRAIARQIDLRPQ